MTIQEAINSGRAFRREGTYKYIKAYSTKLWREDNGPYTPTIEDILADDWELEEVFLTVKKSTLDSLIHNRLNLTDEQYLELTRILDELVGQ